MSMKVMVWYFVDDIHKGMIALIPVVFVLVWPKLTEYLFGYYRNAFLEFLFAITFDIS